MTVDLAALVRQDVARREGKLLLRLPDINELRGQYHEAEVGEQLRQCCDVIVARQLLYGWQRYGGEVRLVRWSKSDGQFLGFDVETFAHFLGCEFDLQDVRGVHYGLPGMATASRIMEALTKDERLEVVDWGTLTERRRAGK